MKYRFLFLLPLILLSCQSDQKATDEEFAQRLESSQLSGPSIDKELVTSILQRIPSPLEISSLLKESGVSYNSKMLNPAGNVSKYESQAKKALNLGVYGADLGYANIYGKNAESVQYLSSIKKLADDLSIGQFFDIQAIGRLAGNSQNLDSLLLLTTQNFNAINSYLQDNNRSNISLMLLVGGWSEAMGILCDVAAQSTGQRDLIEGIGEQKVILEQLVLLLTLYKDDPGVALLNDEFQDLKKAFDAVTIVHTYKEPTMEVVDGVVMIKDNSTTTIDISEAHALAIGEKINAIRTIITE